VEREIEPIIIDAFPNERFPAQNNFEARGARVFLALGSRINTAVWGIALAILWIDEGQFEIEAVQQDHLRRTPRHA
jgi:hypothetical protein